MRFFLGGYGADMGGDADGIGVLHAGAPDDVIAGGELAWAGTAAAAASPSWLAWHPTLDVVYAAQEGHGDVQAFRRTGPGAFAPLGPAVPVGDSVCHVAVSPSGASLIASCYGDGRVARVALDATGAPATVAGAVPGAPAAAAGPVDPYAGLGEERAGQRSSEIASLTLDERTGVPGRVRRRVEAPTPTSLFADR